MVNAANFTLRARSLNSSLYWAAQMVGGVIIGLICDMPRVTRPWRAIAGWVFVFVTGNVIMGGGLAFQNWFVRWLGQCSSSGPRRSQRVL